MARDEEIRGTRLEVTVQHVDTVHVVRRMCSELDFLRVQSVENMLERSFDRILIRIPELIQAFRDSFKKLEAAMRGLANARVPPIRVRAALTLARHTIGWSGKNIERHLREAKAWKDKEIRIRIRRQDADHVYDGCELDDAEMRAKVVEFLDRAMWCHHPRLRDQTGEALLLRKANGRGFWPKQIFYADRVGAARYFLQKFGADWKTHVRCRAETSSSSSRSPSSSSSPIQGFNIYCHFF
jgi:hypothetical protein